MRRTTKVAVVGVTVAAALLFFFGPVSLWFNGGSPVAGQSVSVPVYRSLGCATVGFGDLYAPSWFGFSFGCELPVFLPLSTSPAVAPTDKISLPSGVGICSSNCIYPSPYLSATVLVNASSPLVSLRLFINGTDEGMVASFNNTMTDYGYVLKANPHNASMPIQAGLVYSVELVAAFRDGGTSTATASTVAS